MANLSEDIQCADSDTRPPMLDRTDFASWQQRIRIYCQGKENGMNILKSIDDGPYQMGTYKGETIHDYYVWFAKLINDMRNIKMTMSRMQLNSKFVNNMLPEWGRFVTAVKLNSGLRDSNYDQLYAYLKQHETHPKENKMMLERFSQNTGRGAAGYGGVQNRFGNANSGQARQAKDYDAFYSDVDEAPIAQTMFMANLSSADPVIDEAEPSYDSNILYKVQDHDHYQDAVSAHHEEHTMHDSVQLNHVVDSHVDYTSDSNMISYDQYVKENERITPTGLIEEERGFEQTKECYLKEVIPFFKTLKDNFEGTQKAQTKEIKEMKDVCEELEAEVAQNVVNRKHDAIEQKNLLIARCLELEAELASLRDKSHHDNQEELINRFSKIEHYKELYDSIKITRAKHIEQVTALTTKNVNLKAQILEKVNSVSKDHIKPKVLARGKYAMDVELIVPRLRKNRDAHLDYLKHLKESVETIRDIVEEAKVVRPLDRSIVYACRYTKNSQELLEYAIGTYPQDSQQRDKQLAHIPLIRKKQVTFVRN
nr:retrovirus-related Pol polyprotein from transposon TNT 1-94 [Tanacetum cinerariifolium]